MENYFWFLLGWTVGSFYTTIIVYLKRHKFNEWYQKYGKQTSTR